MKNVLITGANKGLGFEVAKQLVQQGYFVYLGSRDERNGVAAVESLRKEGLNHVEFLKIDVSDFNSVKHAASTLQSKVEVLDILINNAGISGSQPQNISVCDLEAIKEVFNTNYFGAIQTTQHFLPLLRKAPLPVIVNVSSELGSLTMQTAKDRKPHWDNFHVYGATKTALNTFTINLAQEMRGTKFKINSVTPGHTSTDLHNMPGGKTPAQGAEPIVRLAMVDEDGPTGQFFRQEGEVPW